MDLQIEHETPILQDRAKTGKTKYWKKQVLTDGTGYYTRSVFWQDNGTQNIAELCLIQPKNVGRNNEVSPKEQAYKETAAEFKKKLDKGYTAPGYESETAKYLKPMLAHAYKNYGHKLPDVVYWEPKYDGVRCLLGGVNKQLTAWSRQGKPFGEYINELFKDLQELVRLNVILDGELMLPVEEYTFEQTVSAVKKSRPLTQELEYWVYDIYNPAMPNLVMHERDESLKKLGLTELNRRIRVVERELITKDKVQDLFYKTRSEGHEGIMLRNPYSQYEPDTRSYSLMKFKGWECESNEYIIIGVKDGVGREAGKAIFTCNTETGSFDVRMKGSMAYRAELWKNREQLIGKPLTVEYQNLTADGIPRFPVGVAIRDYE